jgi:hypothetical protein
MSLQLLACPSCARHVKKNERVCPFCGVGLSDAFRATPAPKPPTVRLARAALMALGATAVAAASACGGEVQGARGDGTGGEDAGEDSGFLSTAAYGIAQMWDGGVDQQPDTGFVSLPPYGISPPPPPEDAGSPEDAGGTDAGADVVTTVPYGIPPGH